MAQPFDTHRKRRRIQQEIATLRETYTVRIDTEANGIVLEDFRYPANWQPRTAPVMLRVTPLYPHEQPSIYISADITCQQTVTHAWATHHDAWLRWCFHPLAWDGTEHDLETILDLIYQSLKHPNDPDPFTWSDDL